MVEFGPDGVLLIDPRLSQTMGTRGMKGSLKLRCYVFVYKCVLVWACFLCLGSKEPFVSQRRVSKQSPEKEELQKHT